MTNGSTLVAAKRFETIHQKTYREYCKEEPRLTVVPEVTQLQKIEPQPQNMKRRIPLEPQPVQPAPNSRPQVRPEIAALTKKRWQEDRDKGLIDASLNYQEWLNHEMNKLPEEEKHETAGTASFNRQQLRKLSNLLVALGNDFKLFMNDLSVKEHLGQLLDKDIDAEKIRIALSDWRKTGSPATVSPFAELIKTLLG